MKKPSDKQLGMQRAITRRDFVQGAAVAAGTALQAGALASSGVANASATFSAGAQRTTMADYPPVKTGMRGSHPGAYEIAHALARDGAQFPEPKSTEEHYDLIVVGAGISGLAAAHYYQQRFGVDSKILLLENHDDFGAMPNVMSFIRAERWCYHWAVHIILSGGTLARPSMHSWQSMAWTTKPCENRWNSPTGVTQRMAKRCGLTRPPMASIDW